MKRIVLFAAIFVLLASMVTSCGNSSTLSNDGSLTLGSTFICDKFEISLAKNIKWNKIDNPYADESLGIQAADVIVIPVTVTNKSTEAEDVSGYSCYDPNGFQLDFTISAYFDDPDIRDLGTLNPGETKNACIYMLYAGDGIYSIEFSIPNENYYFLVSPDSEEYTNASTVIKVNVVK